MPIQMRTLTGCALAVLVVLASLDGIAWFVETPRPHGLGIFCAGFALGNARDVHRGSPLRIQTQLHFGAASFWRSFILAARHSGRS